MHNLKMNSNLVGSP